MKIEYFNNGISREYEFQTNYSDLLFSEFMYPGGTYGDAAGPQ